MSFATAQEFLKAVRQLKRGDQIPKYDGYDGIFAIIHALVNAHLDLRERVEAMHRTMNDTKSHTDESSHS